MDIHEIEKDPFNFLYESMSLEELDERFKKICEYYFIETFALATLLKTSASSIYKGNEFTCFENYPSEWIKIYNEKKYYLKDPVFSCIKSLSQAQYWHIDHFSDVTAEQKKILYECSDFGIKRGTTIPLLPNSKFNGFLTLISTNIYDSKVIYNLANVSNIYLVKKEQFIKKQKHSILTVKEKEIMELKAQGYHNKQISSILSKTNPTIASHLKHIRRKFGVFTTEQAIAKYYQELIST